MRVAYDTTPMRLSGGGVGTYTRELLAELRGLDDVDVIDVHHDGTDRSSRASRIVGGMTREALYYPRGASRAAARRGADLLHVPASMPARAPRGLPLVLTVHDAIPWTHPEWFTRANALQQRLLVTRAARRADRIITVSATAKQDLVEHVGLREERIDVVHNGISGRFSPAHRDREWLAARFGVEGPAVLSVGTPEPRKNLPGAIAAFAGVRERVPDARLLLVGGDGWLLPDLAERVAALGDAAVVTGRVPDVDLVRLYASADCFLFPSFEEGFGLPPLEAMASGTPVVCSDRPSLPEVVGDAAVMRGPDDAAALADAVVELLSDPERAGVLRESGIAHSAAFTWRRAAEQTRDVYRRLLD